MLFRFNVNDQADYNDEYDNLYVNVKVKVSAARKGYNAHNKDSKKKTLARDRARSAKLARRPQ